MVDVEDGIKMVFRVSGKVEKKFYSFSSFDVKVSQLCLSERRNF